MVENIGRLVKTRDPSLARSAIYSEVQEIVNNSDGYVGPNPKFGEGLRRVMSTNVIYVEKEKDNIFVAVSGIDCKLKNGPAKANCFLFYESPYCGGGFLSEFYKSINKRANDLGLIVDTETETNKEFVKIFESKEKIEPGNLQKIMKPVYEDSKLLKSSGIIPAYYAPTGVIRELLEESINSRNFNSAAYSLSGKNLRGINPEIAFYRGADYKLISTRETEDAIQKLKNPKPKAIEPKPAKKGSLWDIFKK